MMLVFGTLLAQKPTPFGEVIEGVGKLGLEGKTASDIQDEAPRLFQTVLSNLLGVLTVAAVIWFILQFILGAYKWISAGGDAKTVEEARNKVIYAVIGLVIVFLALLITSLLVFLLGIDNILDIQGMIGTLTP